MSISSTIPDIIHGSSNTAPEELACLSENLAIAYQQNDAGDGTLTLHQKYCHTNSLLPIEILGYIFLYSLSMYKRIRPRFDEAPLVFCHVCSFWRHAAIGTSRLWQTLSFDTSRYQNAPVWEIARLVTFWFTNGTPHPLVFSLNDKFSLPSTPHALKALAPFSDRLVGLNLSVQNLAVLKPFFNSANIHLSRLKKLFIEADLDTQVDFEPIGPIFNDAQSLKVLGIRGARVLEHLMFPWSQLSILVIDNLCPLVWRSIFTSCINLQSGAFILDYGDEDDEDDDIAYNGATSYEHLKVFKLTLDTGFDLAVFDHFVFPKLHTFHLVGRHWNTYDLDVMDLFEQLQLNDHLQDVALSNYIIDTDDLLSMITSVMNLTRLTLDVHEIDIDEFFDNLHAAILEGSILPNLSSFTICVHANIDGSSFIQVIRSLCESERLQRLQQVSLFVRAWEMFPGDPQEVIDGVRKHLEDLIYDKDTCPNGFVLTTEAVDETFDIRVAL